MDFIEQKAKIVAPQLDMVLTKASVEVLTLDEEDVYGVEFLREDMRAQSWTVTNVDKCRFLGCDFSGAKIRNVNLTNIVFESCNFSNTMFDEVGFSKVKFKGCKMTGASMRKGFLCSTLFENCLGKLFMLDECKFRDFAVTKCDFESWSVYECHGQRMSIKENRLVGWETRGTSYKGVDLSDNILERVNLELSGLIGARLNTIQACMVADMLGIIVK